MAANGSADDGVNAVTSAIDLLFADDQAAKKLIRGIGVCSPGPLDPKSGVIINPPNLPCWRNFPLGAALSRAFAFPLKDMPVRIDNDGNAAALAEYRWGAGRGYRNVFYATIGTGIGTGIVFDGDIYHGRTGAAAEGGHMSIDYRGPRCACGKHGCIEVLAAGQPSRAEPAPRPPGIPRAVRHFWRWPRATRKASPVKWLVRPTLQGICWPKKFCARPSSC